MLFSEPKWDNGCFVLVAIVACITLLNAAARYYNWASSWSIPAPVGQVIGFLIFLGLARFILNQIFD